MKRLIATTLIAASMIAASAPAHAGQDGSDLLIVNNGDGSDFLAIFSLTYWLGWLR